MKIGIDISQLAYERTGVANYLTKLVEALARVDKTNEYILFYSSLRRPVPRLSIKNPKFRIKAYRFPPTFLERLWNKFHRFPIESFIGDIDVFITSDWVEPPSKKAKKATILYDLISYKYPSETHPRKGHHSAERKAFMLTGLLLNGLTYQLTTNQRAWL